MAFDPTKCFAVLNVRLKNCALWTHPHLDDVILVDEKTTVQTRKWTEHKFVQVDGAEHLKTVIHLGTRLVRDSRLDQSEGEEEPDPDDAHVFYSLEAHFAVDFLVREKQCSDNELSKFVSANATHIAWPFWRAFVFSTLRDASLPLIEVPLMARVNSEQSSAKEVPNT